MSETDFPTLMDRSERIGRFLNDIRCEFYRANRAHPPIVRIHEALGVVEEEFDEFRREVFKKNHDKSRLRAELVQLAAMCLRTVIDLELDDSPRPCDSA
jgi:hypothetical protein